jgi:hypothetical protein
MATSTMLTMIAVTVPFLAFALVLFWAERQTRSLP